MFLRSIKWNKYLNKLWKIFLASFVQNLKTTNKTWDRSKLLPSLEIDQTFSKIFDFKCLLMKTINTGVLSTNTRMIFCDTRGDNNHANRDIVYKFKVLIANLRDKHRLYRVQSSDCRFSPVPKGLKNQNNKQFCWLFKI